MHKKSRLNYSRRIFSLILLLIVLFVEESIARQRFWVPKVLPQTHYKIDARISPDEKQIKGNEIITLTNTSSQEIDEIAVDWSISVSRFIEINYKGQALTPLNKPDNQPIFSPLLYKLSEPVFPGSKLELFVTFKANDVVDDTVNEIKLINWYPRLWWDGLPAYDAFKVKVNIPSGYAMAVSGLLNKKTGYYENNGAKSFGVYLGKGLKVREREVEDIQIKILFTEKGSECANLCLETATDVIKFYKHWHGFYPYRFIYIVPGQPRPVGGYPFSSGIVVIHGQEQFDKRPLNFWKWITAHEIGHQFWGEYVLNGDLIDWLMIGMGIYADRKYAFFRNFDKEVYKSLVSRYLSGVQKQLDTTVDIPQAQFEKISYDHNNIVVHGKGYSIISALESTLGEELFEKVYRRCLRDYGKKRLGYNEFWRVCEEETGENLAWFFDQWVRSNKYLCYGIDYQESILEGNKYTTTINIRCKGTLHMPVPLKAIFEDGTSQTKVTDRALEVTPLQFESNAKLKEAILDPDSNLAMLKEPLPVLPEGFLKRITRLPWTNAGDEVLKIFEEVKNLKFQDSETWFKLGMILFDSGYYQNSFEAFDRVLGFNPSRNDRFASLVWMGHLKDLSGSRKEALKYYREALELDLGTTIWHDQYKIEINRKWVEERLKVPFQWKKPSK
jgi:tetratricopeptide (TPR) repeat protein